MEEKNTGPRWPRENECCRCHKIKELKDFAEIMYIGQKEDKDFWIGHCIECNSNFKGTE